MYAKLTFLGGTTAGQANRDIARLIAASNSGTADLDDLEFINTSSSTLYAGTNSGWSLHSSSNSIPASGTTVSSTDSNFIFEGTTAQGKTKYCAVMINGSFTSTTAYNNASNSGVMLSTVLNPGTALEMYTDGYSSTSTTYMNQQCLDVDGSTVHIWAEPRKIMMVGMQNYSITQPGLIAHIESAESTTSTWQNLVPCATWQHWGSTALPANSQYGVRSATSYPYSNASCSTFVLANATYSLHPQMTGKIRSVSWIGTTDRDVGHAKRLQTWMEDDTNPEGTKNTSTDVGTAQTQYPEWPHIMNTPLWMGLYVSDTKLNMTSNTADDTFGNAALVAVDTSGNPVLPRYPLVWYMPPTLNNDVFDFSSVSKIWKCASALGITGDEVTVDSVTYQYINLGNNALDGMLVEKI